MWADRRRLGVALAVSLVANLFLGGAIAGHLFTRRAQAGSAALAPGPRVQTLPSDQRSRFLHAMAPHRAEIREAHQQVRRARAQVRSDIAAPTYDRARLEADLAALRAVSLRQQVATHAALADSLGQLSPASRAALAAGVGAHPGAR